MTTPLDIVLGSEGAGRYVADLVAEFMYLDGLDEKTATNAACHRVADASPWMLAAPGQIWTMAAHFTEDDKKPRHIRILRRVHPASGETGDWPDVVQFADLARGEDSYEPAGWLRLEDLETAYELTSWPDRSDFPA